jgi:hypothetical protein
MTNASDTLRNAQPVLIWRRFTPSRVGSSHSASSICSRPAFLEQTGGKLAAQVWLGRR